ncbi:MAG: phosphonate ABC transporter ATP-binding protein [Syntrophorhabdaceae bacterium]|nr:phosphonate ABC transporter ATP-binding protein [Syntrophorhabdaceae bacterium]
MVQIEINGLSLGYGARKVLQDLNVRVNKGDFISIIGPSGEGKTTLLMGLNGTIKIFEGELHILDYAVHKITNSSLKRLRSRIGVIFQTFNLVKRMSVLDNIASGMLCKIGLIPAIIKYYNHEQYFKIYEYAKIVGLEKEILKRCDMLSGGQMQRVAIARALAQEPEIILADEPISSLDPVSARKVMEILKNINKKYGITIISNLHQIHYAREYCSRIIGINGGRIVFDGAPDLLTDDMIERIYRRNGEQHGDDDVYVYYSEPAVVNA